MKAQEEEEGGKRTWQLRIINHCQTWMERREGQAEEAWVAFDVAAHIYTLPHAHTHTCPHSYMHSTLHIPSQTSCTPLPLFTSVIRFPRNFKIVLNKNDTEETNKRKSESKKTHTHTYSLVHTPEAPHVSASLTLIRAAEGLTPRGRPPQHSRDGHSQPVNPPRCKRHQQRATECETLSKEMTATQWLQISSMRAYTKRQTDPCNTTTLPTDTHKHTRTHTSL